MKNKLLLAVGALLLSANLFANEQNNITEKNKFKNVLKEEYKKSLEKKRYLETLKKEVEKYKKREKTKKNKNNDIWIEDVQVRDDGLYYIYKVNMDKRIFDKIKQRMYQMKKMLVKDLKEVIKTGTGSGENKVIEKLLKNFNYKIYYIYKLANSKDEIKIELTKNDFFKN